MRIITGSAKGCKLKAPKGWTTRPTTDRVKESLFGILGVRVVEAAVLDLFAGTGNLGLEALSRGAVSAVFVDQSMQSIQVIKDNAVHTKLQGRAKIVKSEALSALQKFAQQGGRFDIVFCDPPYRKGLAQKVLQAAAGLKTVNPGGLVVIEQAKDEPLIDGGGSFRLVRSERYGETVIHIFEYVNEKEQD